MLHAFTWTAITFIVALLVAGWFYWRNAWLYGDPLALNIMNEIAGQRREAPDLATIRAEFEGFRIAYWALFGGVNILAANWIYKILDGASLLAVIGLATFLVSHIVCHMSRLTPHASRLTPHASPFPPSSFCSSGVSLCSPALSFGISPFWPGRVASFSRPLPLSRR
jgi:hypothetical protein